MGGSDTDRPSQSGASGDVCGTHAGFILTSWEELVDILAHKLLVTAHLCGCVMSMKIFVIFMNSSH